MGMEESTRSFKEKLENQHQFPGYYTFKFVVPQGKKDKLSRLLPPGKTKIRESSKQNYVSVTVEAFLQKSDDVIHVYEETSKIEGLIAL